MIERIRESIISLDQPSEKKADLKCAAVLIPLVHNSDNQWDVIFTRRAQHLKHHPGQISFPGGGYELQDNDLAATAIRETEEEIGITPQEIELVGRLPQQQTISQYNVTPFVGIVAPNYDLTIDHNEVAEVFTAPLDYVTDQTNLLKKTDTFNGQQIDYYVIQYKHYNIWGATARILVNLSRRIWRD